MEKTVRQFNGKMVTALRARIGQNMPNLKGGKSVPVSREWLAGELGCSFVSVANYEKGSMPNPTVLARLVDLSRRYQCNIEWDDFLVSPNSEATEHPSTDRQRTLFEEEEDRVELPIEPAQDSNDSDSSGCPSLYLTGDSELAEIVSEVTRRVVPEVMRRVVQQRAQTVASR